MTAEPVPPVTIPTQQSRYRVLIAGHVRPLRRAYTHVLLGHGFDVTSAADGAEALEMLDAACPDVILAEALMPVLDGIMLIEALRGRDVPVPVVVAAEDESLRAQAMRAGAHGYLVVPFGPQALLAALSGPAARGRMLRDRAPVARGRHRRGAA